jgi:hypothetical protein
MRKTLGLIYVFAFLAIKSFSQTIPVGSYTETIARRYQLLGLSKDSSSFTIRPVNNSVNLITDPEFQKMLASSNQLSPFKLFGIPSYLKVLPANWVNEYNSKLPSGYNKGSLYPNAGYQTMLSMGLFMKLGFLNIQFKPQVIAAQNKPFLTFAAVQSNYNSTAVPAFFNIINGIDAPERFGPYGITHANLGQTKITAEYKSVEVGISTENLWWGPGVQNSIMMSNSAPGFLHWTFNSVKPVKTIIGSFEWQLIGGRLQQSGYNPLDTAKLPNEKEYYIPKPKVTRYISAFTANWHPKWIDGLYVGVTAYDYMDKDADYNKQNFFKRVVPVLVGSSNSANTITSSSDGDGQDFAYAFNVRQVLPKYNAEIYFEFARNDRPANLKDLILEPENSSAYTVGGSRLFSLSRKDQFIQVKMELTHLEKPQTYLVRPEPTWYVHLQRPRDGYTNEGRYIGAGIGPGSNSLMFDVSFVDKINSFGYRFERYVHDNDLYYSAFAGTNNFVSHWVDLTNTFYANVKFKKNYLISAEVAPVFTYNYEYLQGNIFNLHVGLNFSYFFD